MAAGLLTVIAISSEEYKANLLLFQYLLVTHTKLGDSLAAPLEINYLESLGADSLGLEVTSEAQAYRLCSSELPVEQFEK